jgi:hypothetical protein
VASDLITISFFGRDEFVNVKSVQSCPTVSDSFKTHLDAEWTTGCLSEKDSSPDAVLGPLQGSILSHVAISLQLFSSSTCRRFNCCRRGRFWTVQRRTVSVIFFQMLEQMFIVMFGVTVETCSAHKVHRQFVSDFFIQLEQYFSLVNINVFKNIFGSI